MFEVRKRVRKIAAEQAGPADPDPKVISKAEAQLVALRSVDLDEIMGSALVAIPQMDESLIPKSSSKKKPDGETATGSSDAASILLKTAPVSAELRALAAVFDPEIKQLQQEERRRMRSGASDEEFDSEAEDFGGGRDSELDSEDDVPNNLWGSDDEEDFVREHAPKQMSKADKIEAMKVAALTGENIKKNRPGQRTRRKLLVKQYGKEAKFIKERKERKFAENPRQTDGAKEFRGKEDKAAKDAKNLHPSWQAKRRQQEAVSQALQGSNQKRKLDHESAQPTRNTSNSRLAKPSGGRRTETAGLGKDREKKEKKPLAVHPSWEAKRKAKEEEAKRLKQAGAVSRSHIKFDEDD